MAAIKDGMRFLGTTSTVELTELNSSQSGWMTM